jgi:flagellar basal-body rod protein FlgB
MGIAGVPLFAALAEKMKWHQARQGLLAENVANAETPGFRGRDLKSFNFEEHMSMATAAVPTATTASGHISGGIAGMAATYGAKTVGGFEVTPDGNAVTLEDEMMKVAGNQMDYQTVTTLYTRSMRLIRTALGRQG